MTLACLSASSTWFGPAQPPTNVSSSSGMGGNAAKERCPTVTIGKDGSSSWRTTKFWGTRVSGTETGSERIAWSMKEKWNRYNS